jgi:predicted HTH transcriptional regulator
MFAIIDELLQFIEANSHSEGRFYEYKKAIAWNDNVEFKHKIIKAILSMSNIRDGGYIILGVEKNNNGRYEALGSEDSVVSTYEQEKVLEAANAFADPYVELELRVFRMRNNNSIVVIQVFEFVQDPVICKKNYPRILEQGRTYVRTFRKPESSADITSSDMREVIDLAIQKQFSKIVKLSNIGISQPSSAEAMYEKERGDF